MDRNLVNVLNFKKMKELFKKKYSLKKLINKKICYGAKLFLNQTRSKSSSIIFNFIYKFSIYFLKIF